MAIWVLVSKWGISDGKTGNSSICRSVNILSCPELCLSFPAHDNPFTAQQRASHCHSVYCSVLCPTPEASLSPSHHKCTQSWRLRKDFIYIENNEKKLLKLFQRKCECFSDVLVLNPANHTLNHTFWLAKWSWGGLPLQASVLNFVATTMKVCIQSRPRVQRCKVVFSQPQKPQTPSPY